MLVLYRNYTNSYYIDLDRLQGSYVKRCRTLFVSSESKWTIDQDIFLIENNSLPLLDLKIYLPFTEDEIMDRKKRLGLIKRAKQMRRLD